MERKYQVTSAVSVMKMIISFKEADSTETPKVIHVGVDYRNERVFFEGNPLEGVDYGDLEQEILAYLRPQMVEPPKISPEMLQRIADIRAGKYGAEVPQYGAK